VTVLWLGDIGLQFHDFDLVFHFIKDKIHTALVINTPQHIMKLAVAVLFLAIVGLTVSAKVVDLYGVFNNFTCLAQQGYYHSIVRAYHSYGAIDLDAPSLIQQSNNAGLSTDVYMFPCRGKNATVQVNELINYLE